MPRFAVAKSGPKCWANLVGWIGVLLVTMAASCWAFWGVLEAFHEGWCRPFLWMRLLQLAAYLAPATLLCLMAALGIRWPRLGAVVFVLVGVTLAGLMFVDGAKFALEVTLCLTGLPMLVGLLFFLGRPRPKAAAYAVALGIPFIILLGLSYIMVAYSPRRRPRVLPAWAFVRCERCHPPTCDGYASGVMLPSTTVRRRSEDHPWLVDSYHDLFDCKETAMDIIQYNRAAWDQQVAKGNRWTVPVTPEAIAAARDGRWQVVLTPRQPVPSDWFPPLPGKHVLCLACGGGQQAPLLAAAGAQVTVLDNSPCQLEQDQVVARREGLSIDSVLGDMRDLSAFDTAAFDLVFHPCSVCFIPEVQSVFLEVHRVLRVGGRLLGGFMNPVRFIFDEQELESGRFHVRHRLPYADESHLTSDEQERLRRDGEPFMFSHSLEHLIAGQLRAGLVLRDLFEDTDPEDAACEFAPMYFATLAEKPLMNEAGVGVATSLANERSP